MRVTRLELVDFRSYPHVEIDLEPGVTVFEGRNGQGKTNLVEALGYLATSGSHRVSADAPLVRAGAERAVVRAVLVDEETGREVVTEIEINPGKANRARLNRAPLSRARDLLGVVRTVLFAPEDLALVKGDPAGRRGFVDDLLVMRSPRFAGVRQDFDRILKQRNSLLKSARAASFANRRSRGAPRDLDSGNEELASRGSGPLATLDIWDAQLARVGAELLAARLQLIADLAPHVAAAYRAVADEPDVEDVAAATLSYRSSLPGRDAEIAAGETPGRDELEAELTAGLEQRRGDELDRGISLVGPHRDDLVLTLGELPAKGYASHGESWSFALALRLGSYDLMRGDDRDGGEPILVLDDVFAELDQVRRRRLAELVGQAQQVLVTAAVTQDVPDQWRTHRWQVSAGQVTPA